MSMEQIGRYEIVGELGEGGMATVLHGYDPRFERDVAIKIMPAEMLIKPIFRERFEREAKTIAALEHHAIVPVYDYGEENGQPYLVMRHMTGGSLAGRIEPGGMSISETARIIERIASALDKAHSKGIIHRDIKPSNILFDEEGNPYLSDFGIVKLAEATAQLTSGGMVGTPGYMAPEMAEQGGLSVLIDVYALGVTVFQMLSGRLPYAADTPIGILMAHMNKPIPDIRKLRPDLPDEIQALIERAMAKDPADRYASASELAAALNQVADATITRASIYETEQHQSASGYTPTIDMAGTIPGIYEVNNRDMTAIPVPQPEARPEPARVNKAQKAASRRAVNPLLIGGITGVITLVGVVALALILSRGAGAGVAESTSSGKSNESVESSQTAVRNDEADHRIDPSNMPDLQSTNTPALNLTDMPTATADVPFVSENPADWWFEESELNLPMGMVLGESGALSGRRSTGQISGYNATYYAGCNDVFTVSLEVRLFEESNQAQERLNHLKLTENYQYDESANVGDDADVNWEEEEDYRCDDIVKARLVIVRFRQYNATGFVFTWVNADTVSESEQKSYVLELAELVVQHIKDEAD